MPANAAKWLDIGALNIYLQAVYSQHRMIAGGQKRSLTSMYICPISYYSEERVLDMAAVKDAAVNPGSSASVESTDRRTGVAVVKTRQEMTRPRWDQDAREPIDEGLERAVIRVIDTMRQNLSEQLTVDDMARAARFSKFHFSRVFQRVTGVSPGRFLSAMRLQEAKRLLLTTSLSVADITFQVGYNSVGTFSTRFKESVGLSPTQYRRFGGYTKDIATDDRRRGLRSTTLRGEIKSPPDNPVGTVFVGLFPDWIPQGFPVKCTVLRTPGPYELADIPPGTWHLLAHAVAPGQEHVAGFDADRQSLVVGANGPIAVRSETSLKRVNLQLRPMRILDPPILLALLDVREMALSKQAG